jgi:hypothetical protein
MWQNLKDFTKNCGFATGRYSPIDPKLTITVLFCVIISASSRISKGQGYQDFLRKRAGI